MLDVSRLVSAGLHNPRIKQYLAIKNTANRENLICVEGLRALSLALKADLEIDCFFVCPALLRGKEGEQAAQRIIASGVSSYTVSEKILHSLADWEGPDGLAALVKLRQYSWQHLHLRTHNTLLVLDGLQIPGNIGTIIRCADGILITHRKQRLSHPKLVRASMGSLFAFPVIETEATEAIAWLRQHDFSIVTTSPDAPLSYRQVSYQGRIAIVVGNEHFGIAQEWYDAHDVSVSIPMNGRSDSLNVGNAATLMLYEAMYQQISKEARSMEK